MSPGELAAATGTTERYVRDVAERTEHDPGILTTDVLAYLVDFCETDGFP